MLELKLLVLLLVANGAPIFARRYLGGRFSLAIDGGLCLHNGQPLLGANKTWRGVLVSIIASALTALLLMLPLWIGVLFAIFAMLGDLLSSFIKRRLCLPESTSVAGLDQVPESLLPLLVGSFFLGYGLLTVILVTALFWLAERWLSPLLFSMGIRLPND